MDALRGLYLVIQLHDEFSSPLKKANALMDTSARRMMVIDKLAKKNTQSWMYSSAAFEKSLANAGAFFAQVDAAANEAFVRQRYQSRIMQEVALKYDTLKRKVVQYGSAVRDSMRRAGAALRAHAEDLRNVGLGATVAIGAIMWRLEKYESAMAKLRALTADNREEFEYYLQILNEFSKTKLFSKSDIANMLAYAKANKLTREELEFLLPYVKSAAAIYGEDLTTALTAMVRAMKYGEAELAERIGLQLRENAVMKESMELYGKRLSELTAEQKQRVIMLAIQRQMANIVGRENEMLGENIVKLRKAKNALDDAAVTIGSYLLPPIAKAATAFANLLKWLDERPILGAMVAYGLLSTALVGIGGYAAIKAAEVLKLVSTTLLRYFIPSSVKAAFATGGLTAALRAFATATWSAIAPLLPAILAISAAILLLQHAFIHNWGGIREATAKVVEGLKWAFGGLVDIIKTFISGFIEPLKWLFDPILEALGLFNKEAGKSKILVEVVDVISGAFKWLYSVIEPHIPLIKQVVRVVGMLAAGFLLLMNPIGQVILAISIVSYVLKVVIPHIQRFISWIQHGISSLGPLKYALLGPAGALLFLAQNFDRVTTAIRGFIEWIQNAWKAITENPIFKALQTLFQFTPMGMGVKATTTMITEHRLPAVNEIMPQPAQMISTVHSSKVEHKTINVPKIEIKIEGVKDPEKVAELVEMRLQRKFNAIGVY